MSFNKCNNRPNEPACLRQPLRNGRSWELLFILNSSPGVGFIFRVYRHLPGFITGILLKLWLYVTPYIDNIEKQQRAALPAIVQLQPLFSTSIVQHQHQHQPSFSTSIVINPATTSGRTGKAAVRRGCC